MSVGVVVCVVVCVSVVGVFPVVGWTGEGGRVLVLSCLVSVVVAGGRGADIVVVVAVLATIVIVTTAIATSAATAVVGRNSAPRNPATADLLLAAISLAMRSPAWMGPNQPTRIAGECRVCTKITLLVVEREA